jgi:hypothetical protein
VTYLRRYEESGKGRPIADFMPAERDTREPALKLGHLLQRV